MKPLLFKLEVHGRVPVCSRLPPFQAQLTVRSSSRVIQGAQRRRTVLQKETAETAPRRCSKTWARRMSTMTELTSNNSRFETQEDHPTTIRANDTRFPLRGRGRTAQYTGHLRVFYHFTRSILHSAQVEMYMSLSHRHYYWVRGALHEFSKSPKSQKGVPTRAWQAGLGNWQRARDLDQST